MSEVAPKIGRIFVVVVGAILLVLSGFIAGLFFPGKPLAVDGEATKDGGTPPEKTASARSGKSPGIMGMKSWALPGTVGSYVQTQGSDAADAAADKAGEGAEAAMEPLSEGATSLGNSILPPFLAAQVPWLVGNVAFQAKSEARMAAMEGVEKSVDKVSDEGDARSSRENAGTQVTRESSLAIPNSRTASAQLATGSLGVSGTVNQEPASWTVQLGRFASQRNAESFAAAVVRRGVGAHVSVDYARGENWFDVRSGNFSSEAAAEADLERLRKLWFEGEIVRE